MATPKHVSREKRMSGLATHRTADIVLTIQHRALCVSCIARRTHVLAARIDDVLLHIGREVKAAITVGACDDCARTAVTYKLL